MVFQDPFILDLLGHLGGAGGAEEVVELFLRMWVDGPRRAPDAVDPQVRELCRDLMMDNVLKHGAAVRQFVTEIGAIDRVAELRAPTLLLVGDLDSSDIHGVVDLVAAGAPRARKVVVPGAAHVVNLDRPEDFDREVSAFLS
ncbi:MAG: alpha/beta hydrolase [Umezawaea sp.]